MINEAVGGSQACYALSNQLTNGQAKLKLVYAQPGSACLCPITLSRHGIVLHIPMH